MLVWSASLSFEPVETSGCLILLLSLLLFSFVHGKKRPRLICYDFTNAQMNLGGAKDRPDLNQVWENVQAKLEGRSVVHEKYAKTSFVGLIWGKIFG